MKNSILIFYIWYKRDRTNYDLLFCWIVGNKMTTNVQFLIKKTRISWSESVQVKVHGDSHLHIGFCSHSDISIYGFGSNLKSKYRRTLNLLFIENSMKFFNFYRSNLYTSRRFHKGKRHQFWAIMLRDFVKLKSSNVAIFLELENFIHCTPNYSFCGPNVN